MNDEELTARLAQARARAQAWLERYNSLEYQKQLREKIAKAAKWEAEHGEISTFCGKLKPE